MCFSQLKGVKHGGIVSIHIHQVLMAALLCDAAVTHDDHVITVHQILITETSITVRCDRNPVLTWLKDLT